MEFEDYEKQCDKIREKNLEYLALFEAELEDAGLSEKTIERHIANVKFYINEYLLRYEPYPMEKGTGMLNGFLGDFFIRKCAWSTPASIKSTAASIKKFYRCMKNRGFVSESDYDHLCGTIKFEMEYWQALCAQYNDPDQPNPFLFDF